MFPLCIKSIRRAPMTLDMRKTGRRVYEIVACDDGLDDPQANCILVDGTQDSPGPSLIFEDDKYLITRWMAHRSNRHNRIAVC
jgi:hypothetical protein